MERRVIGSGSTTFLSRPPGARGSRNGLAAAMALSVLAHAAIAASIAIGEAPEAPAAGAAIDIEIVSSADREAARLAPRAGEAPAAPPLSRPMTAPGGGAASLDLATASAARPDLAVPISRPSEWRGRPPEAPAAAEVLALAPPGGLVRAPARQAAPAKRPRSARRARTWRNAAPAKRQALRPNAGQPLSRRAPLRAYLSMPRPNTRRRHDCKAGTAASCLPLPLRPTVP